MDEIKRTCLKNFKKKYCKNFSLIFFEMLKAKLKNCHFDKTVAKSCPYLDKQNVQFISGCFLHNNDLWCIIFLVLDKKHENGSTAIKND